LGLSLKREIIVFMGAKDVGKTTLINALFPSIAVDFKEPRFFRDYKLEEARYVREVCGSEDVLEILAYSISTWSIFAVMLVFDVTRKSTLYSLEKWHMLVPGGVKVFLVGNKIDLPDREVLEDDIAELADKLGVKYYLVSAATGEGIDALKRDLLGEKVPVVEKTVKEEVAKEIAPVKASTMKKEYLPIPLETTPSRAGLTELEIKILDLIDGRRSASDIARELGLTVHSVMVFLKRLHAKGKIKDIQVIIV